MQTNYGALLHSSMLTTDNITQYYDGHPIKGVMPSPMLLAFLTPRQALSFHPHQQMVRLYWLQDRDSMPNLYTINHPTTLHTHNEINWPCTVVHLNKVHSAKWLIRKQKFFSVIDLTNAASNVCVGSKDT
jgi:hypothetical protein